MARRWVLLMAIGLVLAGGRWESATGLTFDLTKLKSVCVRTESLSTESKEKMRLSEEAIGNHVFVLLKAKLPRLMVARYAGKDTGLCSGGDEASLWIEVDLSIGRIKGGEEGGYFGAVHVLLLRSTSWRSGNIGLGIAYISNFTLVGPFHLAKEQVNDRLNELITDFAAEYYKAGNP